MVSLKNFQPEQNLRGSQSGDQPDETKSSVQDPEGIPTDPLERPTGDDADPNEEKEKKPVAWWLPQKVPQRTGAKFSERDFENEVQRFIKQANLIFSRAPAIVRENPSPEFWDGFEPRQDRIFAARKEANMIALRNAIGDCCKWMLEDLR